MTDGDLGVSTQRLSCESFSRPFIPEGSEIYEKKLSHSKIVLGPGMSFKITSMKFGPENGKIWRMSSNVEIFPDLR